MNDFCFYAPDIDVNPELPQEESGHCIRVLRMKEGDEIRITDGKGFFYNGVISAVSGKRCMVRVEEKIGVAPLWKGRLHIAVAPTKLMDRNEWFVEKAVEIGVDSITFVKTAHSERDVIKMERVEKIAVSAMKQSQKATLPELEGMVGFRRFIDTHRNGNLFIAYCGPVEKVHLKDVALPTDGDTVVLIGPEGDFSREEVDYAMAAGYRVVTLGPSRLRTETAALAAVHMMNLNAQL